MFPMQNYAILPEGASVCWVEANTDLMLVEKGGAKDEAISADVDHIEGLTAINVLVLEAGMYN